MSLNNRKLKICHIITRMIVGGAQENTLFTIIGHIQKGHEVVLLTGPSPGPEGKLLQNVDFPDFEIVEIPHLQREMNPIKDYKAYCEMKRFFKERNFDVVHTHSSKAGILGRAAAWAHGTRAGFSPLRKTVEKLVVHHGRKMGGEALSQNLRCSPGNDRSVR
jgi:glycosyltransferase involved in cell wall biosynthesis